MIQLELELNSDTKPRISFESVEDFAVFSEDFREFYYSHFPERSEFWAAREREFNNG
jgi:hypothetical protein